MGTLEYITCPNCGTTFQIGVPSGKRIKAWAKRFIACSSDEANVACPKCRTKICVKFEDS